MILGLLTILRNGSHYVKVCERILSNGDSRASCFLAVNSLQHSEFNPKLLQLSGSGLALRHFCKHLSFVGRRAWKKLQCLPKKRLEGHGSRLLDDGNCR